MSTLTIARRFRGPKDSANGGYICGSIAACAHHPVTVRLLRPPPLEKALSVVEQDGELEIRDGETLLAQARPGDVDDLEPPPCPAPDAAAEAAARYAGRTRHPAPECFVCGPEREAGDGLRLFCGALAPGVVAAPWTPDASLDSGDARVGAEIVWSALDCPGYLAAAPDMRPMLLGELTARVERRVRVGEPCIVIGWLIGSSGRKHETGTALYGEQAELCGLARAIWIEPRASE